MTGTWSRFLPPFRLVLLPLLPLLLACDPNTTRPRVVPFPEDAQTEVRAKTPAATERLLAALAADSVPIRFSSTRDGYVETPWLNAETLAPTDARPIGTDIVRIRGWVNPGKEGFSVIIVEGAYRQMADPSLPDRELERPLPKDHPVQLRIDSLVARIPTNRAGTANPAPPAPATDSIAAPAAIPQDSAPKRQ
jgi:hypothetical protein